MSTQYWDDVERVFSSVLNLAPDAARARLDELCADRAEIRAEVESLLAAHARGADAFLGHLADGGDRAAEALATGAVIGPFRLVERIGTGGMGTVYRAERADGEFAQQVAVKLIAASVDHPSAARRIRAERQILARLHHPHIVALLDGGITPRGQAYLVMEYVDGVPISRYCREHALPLRDRIELIRRVCGAVHYSHQHFVVHRDLKPANILVTSDGVPKVLDFGVATLLEGSPAAGTTLSRADLGAMTPNYASPEQVRGLPATVASDVYALGVLLFELLAGARPYETAGKPLDEVMRLVVETEAPRPSTAVPREEHRPPYDLKALRGDLDAIVQQALRKAPEERYQSAAALSDDLQRFLSGRPVDAREPSLAYVARKLAAQHRAAFITMAVSLLVIVALLVVSVAQTRMARAERDRARAEAAKARQMAAFLGGVFRNATPARSGGRTPTARDLLDRGTESIARELNGQPDVQASLLVVMADAYSDLSDQPGVRTKALELAQRSLALLDDGRAPSSIDLTNSVYAVGRKYLGLGRPSEALPFFERALKLRESLLGPRSTAVADVLGSLALAHNALGQVDEIGPLFERAIAIHEAVAPTGAAAASLRNNYGVFLLGRRQFDQAESQFRRAIADYETMPWNEQITLPLVNLGELLSRREDRADLDAAQALFERAMSVAVPLYGAESFAVAYDLAYLGDVARRKGDLPRARSLLEKSLQLYAKTMPPDNYEVVAPACYLGETLLDLHQPERALQYLERALRVSERSQGPDHPIAEILVDIANARAQLDQWPEAQAAAEKALAVQRRSLPADHVSLVPTLTTLGQIAARRGRPAEARTMLEEAVRIAQGTLPRTHSSRVRAEAALAEVMAAK